MASDAIADIKTTFFQECEEQLAELEAGLLALEGGEADLETVNAIFRAVHSIKGGAGAFHLDDLVRFAHAYETTLDHLRSGQISATPAGTKVMLRAADMLADLVRAARDGGAADIARGDGIIEELVALSGAAEESAANDDGDGMDGLDFTPVQVSFDTNSIDEAAAAAGDAPSSGRYVVEFMPKPALYAKANEAGLLLRELARLGEAVVSCDIGETPLLPDLDPEGAYLRWTVTLPGDVEEAAIREVFEFVADDCDLDIRREGDASPAPAVETQNPDILNLLKTLEAEVQAQQAAASAPSPAQPAPERKAADLPPAAEKPAAAKAEAGKAAAAANAAQATIRVDIDRVDRLVDLIGELVINQAMLAQRVAEAGLGRGSAVATGLDELERLTREIQDSVMAIRAQPVKPVFQRMSRIVREVAEITGKSVHLITDGENTEVDKTVIERLADPLTHMIRNAIDHGIEEPAKRVAAGKPAEGVVRLSALHRSGRIVIEVADDGAGINRPRVKDIAVRKGLVGPDAVLSDDEIDNLIFAPGFSTAESVSNISGRGVGMDVVKRSIQALGGRISISSRPGVGSTFTMSLPLTLAVLDGMVVSVAGQTLVLPLTAIVETLQPAETSVHSFGTSGQVISVRKALTPLIDVGMRLGFRSAPADSLACVAILVESEGGGRSALLVDAIQDQRQIVVKSLEGNYGHVPGIAAATILGDGRVALILDVDTLVVAGQSISLEQPQAA
ncbi:MAG TPA: chemotaxis protein CheA [Roseiarcus sp.]|nr:chemotaxis protein CheA [Roseiarcus sp.]